ncbi:uncharacterized protein CcaverHIS019_0511180 [Cutaneotrichosporon cavernicola]|uniref:Protein kinase domain-containing protein n=1 Tax=Cutaneotrichosporon cavernicola TaxID=279322 RepID=A0AA48L7S1_9TREE|nr:uncharacterized protein CcaverHIS019_0511180 [Cutaneotrichosporon cavernicola]BEI93490.1 hypothetical protein CcaverHIS019_0511180 [Cutaneotrichosporon cavernicola]
MRQILTAFSRAYAIRPVLRPLALPTARIGRTQRAGITSAAVRSPDNYSMGRDDRPPPPFEPLSSRRGQLEPEDGSEASDIRGSSSSSSSSSNSGSGSGSESSSSSSGGQAGLEGLRAASDPGPKLSLVLPANLRMGYGSAHPELTSLVASIPFLRALHTPEQCPAAEALTRLRIGPLLGAGRTWTVYGASAGQPRGMSSFGQDPSAPGEPTMERRSVDEPAFRSPRTNTSTSTSTSTSSFPQLVVKLFSPDIGKFPRARARSSSSSSTSPTTKEAEAAANMRAALFEAEMYAGPLRSLQGTAVPRYYGVYSGADDKGRRLYALVLERVGRAIHRKHDGGKGTWDDLIPQQRRAVAQLYTKVHGAGVVHGDLELRHIRRELGDGGGLRLIDFEGARFKPDSVEKERIELDGCIGPEWRRWLA